jgi:hypothetical protein
MRYPHSIFSKLSVAALGAALALTALPAVAQQVRVLQGTAFWEGDPGPVGDPYWTQGQYKYDPNGYLLRNRFDVDQVHLMTLYGEHSGKANCVFRKLVVNTAWEFEHPFVRVCRRPQKD